jgi:hypothetical protein
MPARRLVVVDSITEVVNGAAGAVFNDAGVGRDDAGIAALGLLQGAAIAACTVAHTSARIGDARSTLEDGRLTHCNAAATALGANARMKCRAWVDLIAPTEF